MYFDKEKETVSREDLAQLQLERLQAVLFRVSRNVPFYRARFAEAGLDPDKVYTLDDLKRVPFTTKSDLLEHYPYGLFAVPLREVVRLHASSGTTGKPIVVGYTANDLKRWANLCGRILVAAGLGTDDVVQIAFAYGLFTGGFGLHQGAERIGASVIPASVGNDRKQIRIMQDYRTTALACTPSYALHLADVLAEEGVNANALSLKWGLFGGETWSEAMRTQIEDRLKIKATDNYGASEVMGPGVAGECLERSGLHLAEDHFLFEIVDPETGEEVPHGDVGELVVTTLTKEAFPLVRYRTGDRTRRLVDPCPCGRTFHKIDRILGRTDDMFTVRGVNVFPSQIAEALAGLEAFSGRFQIELTRAEQLDRAVVLVEAPEALLFDQAGQQLALIDRLKRRIHQIAGVGFDVKLVEKKSLGAPDEKIKQVVDQRII